MSVHRDAKKLTSKVWPGLIGLLSLSVATMAQATTPSLKASFTCSPSRPIEGQTVKFTDASTGGPTSWLWDFGDGTKSTSQNPSHSFATPGTMKVTLVVVKGTVAKRSSRAVSVVPRVATASFDYSPINPGPGETVRFTDTTAGEPTSWLWIFGDGGTSAVKDATHVFRKEGSYVVTLDAADGLGSKKARRTLIVLSAASNWIPVVAAPPKPVASFSFLPAVPVAGQSVLFADASIGEPTSWSWDFADGTTGAGKEARHVFEKAGAYDVTLTVANSSGSHTVSEPIDISPSETLVADFAYTPGDPVAGQPVIFADTSVGTPTSWLWSFGDGGTSMIQFPLHNYSRAGVYIVTLTVKSDSNASTLTKTVTVTESF